MRVAAIALAHLLHGLGEEALAIENIGVFREEAKDEPRHEMVHVVAAVSGSPSGVFFE